MEYFLSGKFSSPVKFERVAADWGSRGYSCDWFSDPPGQEWNNFVHSCNELVTVIEGKLQMTVNGEVFLVKPGDEVFIPSGARHSVKNMHSSTTRWLYGYD